jgi:hypothetical protein
MRYEMEWNTEQLGCHRGHRCHIGKHTQTSKHISLFLTGLDDHLSATQVLEVGQRVCNGPAVNCCLVRMASLSDFNILTFQPSYGTCSQERARKAFICPFHTRSCITYRFSLPRSVSSRTSNMPHVESEIPDGVLGLVQLEAHKRKENLRTCTT